jgi:MFS family permease
MSFLYGLRGSFSLYRGLPRAIYVLFLAQIVSAIGNLVYPFLTFFLTQRLGYGSSRAGLFIFAASVAFVPGSLIGGKLADHIGRKKVLAAAQALSAAALIPCAFLGASPLVPWLLILSHFFIGGSEPTHEAITSDLTQGSQRKTAFSLIYLGHNIGFSLGPMIAGYLFTHHLPLLFFGDALTTFGSVILVLLLVPESKPSAEEMASHGHEEGSLDEKAEEGGLLQVLLRRPFLLAFALVSLLLTFVYSQFSFSLPLQMEALFPERGPLFFGSLMTVNALVVIFFTTPIVGATKNFRPVLTVALAAKLYAMGFGSVYFMRQLPLFALSTLIWTLGEILQVTNTSVYVANHTPISHRGRFNSILPLIIGTG